MNDTGRERLHSRRVEFHNDHRGARRSFARMIRAHRGDLIGISVIAALILLFLSPAFVDGGSFGGFDLDTGRETALGLGLFHSVHSVANGDAVSQMVSWNALDWRMIHAGNFPLWNEYSVLGMPEFLNFESSVLSLPDLVSYAFPIQLAFLVVVAMKFFIAGTGAYTFARTLRLRSTSATFAGVSFMFAGAFAGWVTWPLSDVVAWTGWICALALLAYRAPRGHRFVIPLAIAVAFSIYGGFPEGNVMVAMALGVALVVGGLGLLVTRRRISPLGIAHCLIGAGGGVALAAPLWFAGQQVIAVAHRQADGHYVGLPVRSLSLLIAQGYFGLPTGAQAIFQLNRWNYYETVSYVGVVALALGVVAILISRRRIVVAALVVALLFTLFATYEPTMFHPFQNFIDHAGELSAVRFERMRTVDAFFVAMLGAIGIDTLCDRIAERRVQRAYFASIVLVGAADAYLVVTSIHEHLKGPVETQRFESLIWPTALVFVLMVVAIVLVMSRDFTSRAATRRLARGIFGALFFTEASFLFFAGVGIPSYSNHFYGVTAAEKKLSAIVGTSLLGLDGGNVTNVRAFHHIGFYPNVNIGYGIRLFGAHDPLIPAAYFSTWPVAGAGGTRGVGLFVPDVDTVALARRYGISYLIAPPKTPAPKGTIRIAVLNGEPLFFVPKAAQFSFVGPLSGASVRSVDDRGNGSWTIEVAATRSATLILRVTALPGWHLTSDGSNVALHAYDGVMESATIPPGQHTLALTYWPRRLDLGIKGALAAAGALLLWVICAALMSARRRRRADPPVPIATTG